MLELSVQAQHNDDLDLDWVLKLATLVFESLLVFLFPLVPPSDKLYQGRGYIPPGYQSSVVLVIW